MATRGLAGPRATGTDGTDFLHRERVANHYTVSAVNKARVKWTVLCHILLFILGAVRIAPDLLDLLQIQKPQQLRALPVPPSRPWELTWVPSILGSLFAFLSLRQNNLSLLRQAAIGQIVLGLMSVCYGFYDVIPELIESYTKSYTNTSDDKPTDSNYTYLLLVSAFLAVALQVHVFQLFFSQQLIAAWKSSTTRKVK